MAEVQRDNGPLCQVSLAAKLMDVSRQRMYQLIDEGTFRSWEFFGHRYVCANDVKAFMEVERKSGRPWKEPSAKELWKMSQDWAKGK